MSTDKPSTVDWDAALAEIEAQIATLQATAAGIRQMKGIVGSGGAPGGGSGGGVKQGAFLKMSIPDATKKHLEGARQKLSTQEIMDALEKGGLPKSKYNTVYSILRRRQKDVGDIINMQGDWALAEWYPNYRAKGKTKDSENGTEAKKEPDKKATA